MTRERLVTGLLTALFAGAGGFGIGCLVFGPLFIWLVPKMFSPAPMLTEFGFWFMAASWGIGGVVRGFGTGIKA